MFFFHKTIALVSSTFLVQGYLVSLSNEGQRCKHMFERNARSTVSRIPTNGVARRNYCLVHLDDITNPNIVYGCDIFYTWNVKHECLLCGQSSNVMPGGGLCPGNGIKSDNPERSLTCEYCRLRANPCQNGGTPVCYHPMSYASDMRCECAPGYAGNFCENVSLLDCNCRMNTVGFPDSARDGNNRYDYLLEVNGKLCTCTTAETDDDNLPSEFCDEI